MTLAKDIQDDIITTLQGINGAPTYNNTMISSRVKAGDEDLGGLIDVPAFRVIRGEDDFDRLPQNRAYRILQFEIKMVFMHADEDKVDSWIEDVVKAIAQDKTRGGNCHETWINTIGHSPEVLDHVLVYRVGIECRSESQFGTA